MDIQKREEMRWKRRRDKRGGSSSSLGGKEMTTLPGSVNVKA